MSSVVTLVGVIFFFGPIAKADIAGAPLLHPRGHEPIDWNGDGFLDKVFHFETRDTGIQQGDREACLTGETFDGAPIEGCDAILTVPRCGLGFELALLVPTLAWARRSGAKS